MTLIGGVAAALGLLIVSSISAGGLSPTPISSDPYTNAGAQHQTQVEPDSFAFGQTIVAVTQSGRYFSGGGSSNIVFATSQNGGLSWRTGGLPGTTVNEGGPWPRISDPAVAYDPRHNVWLAQGLGIDSAGTGHIILVNRSTDGGFTWSNPVTVAESSGSFWDKTWITCDTWASSPHYGNCYSQYDDNGAGNIMRMITSADGGLTWGPIRTPSGAPSGLGGQPVVQSNGNVIVPYSANGGATRSFRSIDGGATWSSSTLVSTVTEHTVAGNMRTSSLPSAEVAGDGKVYVAWQDCRFRSGCPANDIVYSTSTDGLTWSAVTRVPIDATNSGVDHFVPGIAVDRATSGPTTHLALTYYYFPVSNCTISTCELNVGFVKSSDGGTSWAGATIGGPMNVSWIANTNQGRMVGDYISTSFTGDGTVHPIFSLARSPSGSTFNQRLFSATFEVLPQPPSTRPVRTVPPG